MASMNHPGTAVPRRTAPPALIESLRALLGERFSTARPVREHHGRDESHFDAPPPDGVAFPRTTDDVAAIVSRCAEHATPIIAFGAGTSVEGQVLAVQGGIA